MTEPKRMVTREERTPLGGIAARPTSKGVKDTIPNVLEHEEPSVPEPTGSPAGEVDAAKSTPDTAGDTSSPKKSFDPWRFGSITMPPELLQSLHEGPREQVPPEQFRALIAGETVEDEHAGDAEPRTAHEGVPDTTTSEQLEQPTAAEAKRAAELPTQKLPRVLTAERERRRRRIAIGVAGAAFVLLGFTWWAVGRGQPAREGDALEGIGTTRVSSAATPTLPPPTDTTGASNPPPSASRPETPAAPAREPRIAAKEQPSPRLMPQRPASTKPIKTSPELAPATSMTAQAPQEQPAPDPMRPFVP